MIYMNTKSKLIRNIYLDMIRPKSYDIINTLETLQI